MQCWLVCGSLLLVLGHSLAQDAPTNETAEQGNVTLVDTSVDIEVTEENATATTNITEIEVQPKMETFQEFENRMKKSANDMIRRILPTMMKGASETRISGRCASSMMRIIGGVRQLREWALRFVDAMGKLPPGVLEGTSLSLGDYDQCLEIQVGKKDNPPKSEKDILFTGQYCLIESHRPEALQRAVNDYQNGNKDSPIAKTKTVLNLFIRYKHLANNTMKFGVCIPSTCSADDLQKILQSESLKFAGRLRVSYCEGNEVKSERSVEQYILLVLFGFIVICLFCGTCIDIFQRVTSTTDDDIKENSEKPRVLTQWVRAASLYSNSLELLDVKNRHEPITVLCALRPITVLLTIYSHTYGHIHDLHFQKFSKPANFIRFFESFTFAGVANGSVGMDTIIFIAGITITYSRWRKSSSKSPVKINVFSLLIQRYVRLSTAQLLVIGLFLLVPLFGSGPLWTAYVDKLITNCKERWWLNILYVGNFWSSRATCLYHTWILAVIMQLTVLSSIILCLLKWSPKSGICLSGILILAGVVGVALMTIFHDLPGSMAFYMHDIRTAPLTWRRIYTLAYDHVGPFCIGMLTGYFLAIKRDTLKINKIVCTLLWCTSICCTSAVLFGLYKYRKGDRMGVPLSTFYAVTHRNVWAMGIAWLVVGCATNNAGVVSKILHSKIFLPMDRLCYMAYLVHIPIMYYHSGTIRERWYMGHFELLFHAIGYMALSFILSSLLYIIFVRPYYFLESQLSSCFNTKHKVKLEKNPKLQIGSISGTVIPTNDQFGELSSCVNVKYSQKTEAL